MISARHRFHGYGSLKNVYKNGTTTRGPLFSIKSQLNTRRSSYRLAVVVSRKVHKSAVGRNRIRRRLYETVRDLESDIVQPFDIVISVFADSILELSPTDLQQQLKKQLFDAGILVKRVK